MIRTVAAAALAIAACQPRTTAPRAQPPRSPPDDVARQPVTMPAPTGTTVVTLAQGQATPILKGPFTVTAINPGSDLYLGFSPFHICADSSIVWFGYSGGGVVVGPEQTLCARSTRSEPHPQAFSGHE